MTTSTSKQDAPIVIAGQAGYDWRIGYNPTVGKWVAINVPFYSIVWPGDTDLHRNNIDTTGATAEEVVAYVKRTTG